MDEFWDKDNLPPFDWQTFRKTSLTSMTPIQGPCTVDTREGPYSLHEGWAGWLAVDTAGYPYPIAEKEHRVTYKPAEPGARFRIGNHLGRTVYYDDKLIGVMDTPEWGQRVVDALNN